MRSRRVGTINIRRILLIIVVCKGRLGLIRVRRISDETRTGGEHRLRELVFRMDMFMLGSIDILLVVIVLETPAQSQNAG